MGKKAKRRKTPARRNGRATSIGDWAPNVSAMARAEGVSRRTAGAWINHPNWNQSTRGPFYLPEVRQFRQSLQEDRNTADFKRPPPDLGRIRSIQQARKLKLEGDKLELVIQRFNREFVKVAEAEKQIGEVFANIRSMFLAEPRSMADQLEADGLVETEERNKVEEILYYRVEAICNQLADGLNDSVEPESE